VEAPAFLLRSHGLPDSAVMARRREESEASATITFLLWLGTNDDQGMRRWNLDKWKQ
jgi:hypothetical protein